MGAGSAERIEEANSNERRDEKRQEGFGLHLTCLTWTIPMARICALNVYSFRLIKNNLVPNVTHASTMNLDGGMYRFHSTRIYNILS